MLLTNSAMTTLRSSRPSLTLRIESAVMAPSATTIILVGAAGAAAIYLFILRQRRLAMLPTDEEQAWLDEQLRTPRPPCMSPGSQVSDEEQKWLDKQIQNVETEDVRLCPATVGRMHSQNSGSLPSRADAGRREASGLRSWGGQQPEEAAVEEGPMRIVLNPCPRLRSMLLLDVVASRVDHQ
jgi:hypothetical protein